MAETTADQIKVPKGYEAEASGDLVGFWDPEMGPIHCIPHSSRAFDSTIDPNKSSVLIVAELVDDCPNLKDAEGEQVVARKGQEVGIWYKPGMRGIKKLAGVRIYMYASGEQDTGKPNPMQLFTIRYPKGSEGMSIPCEDMRSRSLPASGASKMLAQIPL